MFGNVNYFKTDSEWEHVHFNLYELTFELFFLWSLKDTKLNTARGKTEGERTM